MNEDVKESPLDELVLNLHPIEPAYNENDKPVFGIADFARKIALPKDANKKVEKELLSELRSMYKTTITGFTNKTWSYEREEQFIRQMPFEYFQKRLMKEELIAMYKSSFISHDKPVEEFTKNDPDAFFFHKCWLTYHHSTGRANWNAAVKTYNALKVLSFDELGPDFHIKYDASSHYNKKGYSRAMRVYLDGELGVLLYHKNKHVLTIGLDFRQDTKNINKQTVRIQQIQCASKKGNRWLFSLPTNFVAYFTKKLWCHFTSQGFDVELVKSTKVVEDIRTMYMNNYEFAKKSWDEIRNCTERAKQSYGEGYMRHKMYCYKRFKEEEEHISAFDNKTLWRMFSVYSVRIPGLKRVPADKDGYNKLVLSGGR